MLTIFQSVFYPDVIGDGVTDDAPAIQAAIDEASPRAVVQLPPVDCALASTLHINNGITLQGTGEYGSCLLPAVGVNAISVVTRKPFMFRDFHIRYPVPALPNTAAIVLTGDATGHNQRAKFNNLLIENAASGIVTLNAAQWVIDSCTIRNFSQIGVQVENDALPDGGGSNIVNSTFTNVAIGAGNSIGIYQVSSGGLKVFGNYFLSQQRPIFLNVADGIATSDLLIENNNIEQFTGQGIVLESQGSGTFNNVIIEGNEFLPLPGANYGVLIKGVSQWLKGLIVIGNIFDQPSAIFSPVGVTPNTVRFTLTTPNIVIQ